MYLWSDKHKERGHCRVHVKIWTTLLVLLLVPLWGSYPDPQEAIYSPSWLEVDAILDEYKAPTPPTYTPPAEAALSQAACVCWIILLAAFKEVKLLPGGEIAEKDWFLYMWIACMLVFCSRICYTIPLKSWLWHGISRLMSIPGGSAALSCVCGGPVRGASTFSQMQISYVCWGYGACI